MPHTHQSYHRFGVIGAGAWGTALANSLLQAGREVVFWAHAPEVAKTINTTHENAAYLPGVKLDPRLKVTLDLGDLASCDAWLVVTPAQRLRAICRDLAKLAAVNTAPVIIASKGIEQGTAALMSEVVAAELPRHAITILSGPSFAAEVALGKPAALTLATKYITLGEDLVTAMATPLFRLYRSDDIIGAQIGGAVKNVLAVACGIVAGRQLGNNARAAIITRGLAEIIRLGTALGAKTETMMGLSGVGDLSLTCFSSQSRNMSFGIQLAVGVDLADILASRSSVAEGVTTAAAAHALAKKHNIDMPIVAAMDAIINHNADIDKTITDLLARPLKVETA